LPKDHFAIRWTGWIRPLFSETHTFSVKSDDGCRLWIGDKSIVNQWAPQSVTEVSGAINLTAGRFYPITLEYFEDNVDALIQLSWQSPNQAKEIVPTSALFSEEKTLSKWSGLLWGFGTLLPLYFGFRIGKYLKKT
jgi:mannan endo-1,4-beta-mannosidase